MLCMTMQSHTNIGVTRIFLRMFFTQVIYFQRCNTSEYISIASMSFYLLDLFHLYMYVNQQISPSSRYDSFQCYVLCSVPS